MGLDAATIGPTVIDRTVESRMAECARNNLAEYWQLLRTSPLEQQELIEAVVVPETWFFRDVEVFDALARVYDLNWLGAHPGAQLRLLSLPCSTGEEPYTMAMALLDAGFPMERLGIDAIDISERALAKARRGLYGSNSFRGRDLQYRDRHFQPAQGGWQLRELIRERVNFRRGNVLDIGFLPGESLYDAIFCRNLLIYFNQETQIRTVGVLSRLLRPQGLLFVGPAETGLMLSLEYISTQMPMAFAFRKPRTEAGSLAPPTVAFPLAVSAPSPAVIRPVSRAHPKPKPFQEKTTASTSSPPAPAESLLEVAKRLADIGSFDEAAVSCEAHLKAHGPSAQALYLMGLIHGATGKRTRAEDLFRKALYLEPDHEETLMHLALLLETKGDVTGGRVLRLRAKRHHSKAS
ncbi:MAG TPA: CheR family methyltransferase [Lysobacter sp.]|nr:CheR family methyltransferase [Lysobacter sp.]